MNLQLVTFRLGKEEFGVDIQKVQEINKMMEITRIPNAPDYVEGVVNLRGKVIPIVSLRTKLGFDQVEQDKSTRIMVVEVEGKTLGFVVDSVSEVLRINDAGADTHRIEPAPALTGGSDSVYIEGIINLTDRLLILLDLKALLGDVAIDRLAA